jgi:hypothetical protein
MVVADMPHSSATEARDPSGVSVISELRVPRLSAGVRWMIWLP